MALKDELGKMIGPLPLGAWVAVVGGGLGYLYYTKTHPSAAGTDTSTDDTSDATATNAEDAGVGLGGVPAGYTYTGDTSGDSGATGTPSITDNTSWASAATNYLISKGYDPASAQTAITVYINGGSPTTAQWTMISAALAGVGALPDPTTTTNNPPGATTTTPAAKAAFTPSSTGNPTGTYYATRDQDKRNKYGQTVGIRIKKGSSVRVLQFGEIGTTVYAQSYSYYYPLAYLSRTKP